MLVVAILICTFPPLGILALLIYIFVKDHGALAESIYIKATVMALGIVLIGSPFAFIYSIIYGIDQKPAGLIACAIFTLVEIIICITAVIDIISRKKRNRIYRDINMIPVNSLSISDIGYKDGTLYVRVKFGGGRTYSYFNVPDNVYEELKSSASIECYYADHIKCQYEYTKL